MRNNEEFDFLILSIVEEIPYGKVACYGQIAKLAGYPKHARMVGKVLSRSALYGNYPCHRVVNSNGRLAPGFDQQENLLLQENVIVNNNHVNMKRYSW